MSPVNGVIRGLVRVGFRLQITREDLAREYHYNPETGEFTRLVVNGPHSRVGDIAKPNHAAGYVQVRVNKRQYLAHRLAFLYMTGEMPKYVDHIDCDKTNNRWENLRSCTPAENCRNRVCDVPSKFRPKGITPSKNNKNPFTAQITRDYVHYYLGNFPTEQEAAHAYNKAAIELHGEFAVLNPIGEDNVSN